MCGFIGCIHEQPISNRNDEENQFRQLHSFIKHRGPDEAGFYMDDYINLGFRRLSIIDIETGSQPLSFDNKRYWIVFNGEIYNYLELREELQIQGIEFSTNSDTEVILAIYSLYKEKVVEKLRGMFAFLIWDKEEEVLFGARDRFGIKPLYYYFEKSRTFFSSEEKSFAPLLFSKEIDVDSLQHYFSYQYVPEPFTLQKDIKKILPGHYFYKKPGREMSIKQYWKASFQPKNKTEENFSLEIQRVLEDSVKVHMRSDVPVGSFLSSGIDSTIIAALAKRHKSDLKTFSVGFPIDGYSEIELAQDSAEKLKLENISHCITAEEFMNELPKIIWHLDDPLADPACVPLYFVAKLASKHVKVVLSGEGADELFGGYNIYHEPHSLRFFDKIPSPLLHILRLLAKIIPEGVRGKSFLERGTTPLEKRYIGNAKIFEEKEKVALLRQYNRNVHYTDITQPLFSDSSTYHSVEKMQYVDLHTWLNGDILLKADKMTMAHSLELRVPFLDKEVFSVALEIPVTMKINQQTTKYILRQAANGIVPESVLNRRKLGFPVPIRLWLKDEMYDWAKEIINKSQTDYLLHKHVAVDLLEAHRKNKGDYSRKIWTILVFMLWHSVFVEKNYSFVEESRKETDSATYTNFTSASSSYSQGI